jgi:iron complex transport system ATP-binding protein
MSLDPRHQLVVMELIAGTAHAGGAVLAIVHDLALAARFADRVVMMDRGRLVAEGEPGAVLSPARIAAVFGVEASIVHSAVGAVPIMLRPL